MTLRLVAHIARGKHVPTRERILSHLRKRDHGDA